MRTFAPSHLRTLAPSHLRTFAPSHLRTFAPSRLSIIAAALLLCSACAATRPPNLAVRTAGKRVELAVATWNVHAGRGDLPRFVDDLVSGRVTGSPVQEYVILLQENIQESEHDAIAFARARQLSAFFVPLWVSRHGVSGNAILSTMPLLNARPIELPRERRVRTAAAATLNLDGIRMFVVCMHLENRTTLLTAVLLSDSARGRQARALVDALPDGPGIVGGDLNTWLGPDEPAAQSLLGRFEDTPRDRQQPTFYNRLVLDYLFFDLPEGWAAAREVVRGLYGSDHHPVVGVIYRL